MLRTPRNALPMARLQDSQLRVQFQLQYQIRGKLIWTVLPGQVPTRRQAEEVEVVQVVVEDLEWPI